MEYTWRSKWNIIRDYEKSGVRNLERKFLKLQEKLLKDDNKEGGNPIKNDDMKDLLGVQLIMVKSKLKTELE